MTPAIIPPYTQETTALPSYLRGYEMSKYWGYHLILDCAGCYPESITDYDNIYNFAKRLVNEIDMVAYGEPQIVNFGSGNKAGYTLVQLIETSNICAHFVNESNAIYLDVFSCKPYDENTVIDLVREYFAPKSIKRSYISRQA
jgi:S-adenosylmethionine/arginine decarboxylase-like enzyme